MDHKTLSQQLTLRESKQVRVALWYAENEPEAGIPGHTLLLLIAKLVRLLLDS